MSLYAAQGFDDFLLLTGWQADRVEAALAGFPEIASGAWSAECVDTGDDTPTGGRVDAVREQLRGGTFALTYADGVADIDLGASLDFHRAHHGLATITVVRPRSPWGRAMLDSEDRVTGFVEKPVLQNWINGGFMLLEEGALDFIGPDDILEQRPLENLATAGELHAFKHEGFWDCMDTFKDAVELNQLCAAGTPPWLNAPAAAHGGNR